MHREDYFECELWSLCSQSKHLLMLKGQRQYLQLQNWHFNKVDSTAMINSYLIFFL